MLFALPAIAAGLLSTCSTDGRVDGRDIPAFVDCYITGAAGCQCWDLSDDAVVNAADASLLVATLLGNVPFAVADYAATLVNNPVAIPVVANDLDPHGPGTGVVLDSSPGHGMAVIGPGSAITYTPAFGYAGPDSFTYRAFNAFGPSAPATVHLTVAACPAGFGNCDNNPANGCESALNTLGNCGGCDIPCFLPNATESCASGTCLITTCDNGYANCDGFHANGCETPMNTGAFCPGLFLGTINGDTGSQTVTAFDLGEDWYRVTIAENNAAAVYLSAIIQLSSPPGVNYDLFVHCGGCGGPLAGVSTTSGLEVVQVRWADHFFPPQDDTHDIVIEVRWSSGASCSDYSLSVTGNVSVATETCTFP